MVQRVRQVTLVPWTLLSGTFVELVFVLYVCVFGGGWLVVMVRLGYNGYEKSMLILDL